MDAEKEKIIRMYKGLGEKATMLPCPRCGQLSMDEELFHNALSRRTDLYICSTCGTEEAIEDFSGKVVKPLEEWFLFTDIYSGCGSVRENERGSFELTAKRRITVTKDDIDDIMSAALDGGITYWCRKAEVVEDKYYGEYASEQISRGGSLMLYDSESDEKYLLTLSMLLNGIMLAFHDGVDWIDGDGESIDTCQIDALDADAIVQYAIFGEVVFG